MVMQNMRFISTNKQTNMLIIGMLISKVNSENCPFTKVLPQIIFI